MKKQTKNMKTTVLNKIKNRIDKSKTFENGTKKFKRGISLAETIIAMAIIAIVTTSAISVIQMSANYSGEYTLYNEARTLAENSLECFKYARNQEEFETALSYNMPSKDSNIYTYESGIYKVTIIVSFYDDPEVRDKIDITVYGKNGKTIFTFDYTKG